MEVENDARVSLALALDTTPLIGPAPVILDIDAFKQADLPPTDNRMWEYLEQLRELKNKSFFATITEKAVELYL